MRLPLYLVAFMAAVQTSVAFAPSAYRAGVSSPSSRHPQHERHARNSAHQYRSSRNRSDCRSRCQTVAVRGMVPGELPEDGGAGKVGVIVCDHGSRREQANQMLFEVAERYRCFAGCDVVEAAHMEMAEPTIEQAFDKCVAAGASKIVLHPFFLSPGRHVTSDIPALMRAAAARHPGVAWVISEPLGLQELMPKVMHLAVQQSVAAGSWRYGDEEGGALG